MMGRGDGDPLAGNPPNGSIQRGMIHWDGCGRTMQADGVLWLRTDGAVGPYLFSDAGLKTSAPGGYTNGQWNRISFCPGLASILRNCDNWLDIIPVA